MTLHPSRLGLARQAFDRAVRENEALAEAGTISWPAALARFNLLRAAYYARREQLRMGSFINSHGLAEVFGRNWAERMKVGAKEGWTNSVHMSAETKTASPF